MKNIVVLGGGISGLALLWYLKKHYGNAANLILLEKNARVGGLIHTVKKEGFLFEHGPRSCRTRGQGIATLQLVEELNLQDQLIVASRSAHQRFLYHDKHLQKIPNNLFSLTWSPLTRSMISKLLWEWRIPPSTAEDESIHSFFSRRLGSDITNIFLDALTSGIYAGNIHELSIRSCFPQLFQWEREHGSLWKGAWISWLSKNQQKMSPYVKKMRKAKLFSFKEGMETLPKTLATRLATHIYTNHAVTGMQFLANGIELQLANGEIWKADEVYSTLPARALAPIIYPHHRQAGELLNSITAASVAVVSLGYNKNLLPLKGFGYLIPSMENENILGMVWDSCVFPEQNVLSEETRLTVMIRVADMSHFKESDFLRCALDAVTHHLKIEAEPNAVDVHRAEFAIPQYLVGHDQKKMAILSAIQELSPRLHVLGSSFNGVAVNECIFNAKKIIKLTIEK